MPNTLREVHRHSITVVRNGATETLTLTITIPRLVVTA